MLIHFLYILYRFGIDRLLLLYYQLICWHLQPQSGILIFRMYLLVKRWPSSDVYSQNYWCLRFWFLFTVWPAVSDLFLGLENIIFSNISKYWKYQKYHDIFDIFDTFDIFDIFEKTKILNKLYNNGCNSMMQYLMTISYRYLQSMLVIFLLIVHVIAI